MICKYLHWFNFWNKLLELLILKIFYFICPRNKIHICMLCPESFIHNSKVYVIFFFFCNPYILNTVFFLKPILFFFPFFITYFTVFIDIQIWVINMIFTLRLLFLALPLFLSKIPSKISLFSNSWICSYFNFFFSSNLLSFFSDIYFILVFYMYMWMICFYSFDLYFLSIFHKIHIFAILFAIFFFWCFLIAFF